MGAHKHKNEEKFVPKFVTKKEEKAWLEISEFLEDAEKKLDKMLGRLDDRADKSLHKFEDFWDDSVDWLEEKLEDLGGLEERVCGAYDETKLQAHLAKMDAHDHWQEVENRVSGLKQTIHRLAEKSGRDVKSLTHKFDEIRLRMACEKQPLNREGVAPVAAGPN